MWRGEVTGLRAAGRGPVTPLPVGWRDMRLNALRGWLRASPYTLPYLAYQPKHVIIAWMERNVEPPRCPTCGRLN